MEGLPQGHAVFQCNTDATEGQRWLDGTPVARRQKCLYFRRSDNHREFGVLTDVDIS